MNVPAADPASAVALVTRRRDGQTDTAIALRAVGGDGHAFWRTATEVIYDDEVITIVRLAVVAPTDTAALGLILDDATRNGEVTVTQLSYALREHRTRALAANYTDRWQE